MQENLDVVSGWKQVRHDPWHKVGPSRIFNALVSWMTGVNLHDHNCGMKCYRREVLGEVRLYGELHRFVPVLAAGRGFRVGEIVINHRARKFGQSKYGVTRFVKGFLDLLTVKFLTGYGQRPQHLLGTIGLSCFSVGGLWATGLALYRMISWWGIPGINPIHLHESPAPLYAIGLCIIGCSSWRLALWPSCSLPIANRTSRRIQSWRERRRSSVGPKRVADEAHHSNCVSPSRPKVRKVSQL